MARRMIRVRDKETGDIAMVSERAFRFFSASHERLDQPPAEPDSQPPAVEAAAPVKSRRAAPKNNGE